METSHSTGTHHSTGTQIQSSFSQFGNIDFSTREEDNHNGGRKELPDHSFPPYDDFPFSLKRVIGSPYLTTQYCNIAA